TPAGLPPPLTLEEIVVRLWQERLEITIAQYQWMVDEECEKYAPAPGPSSSSQQPVPPASRPHQYRWQLGVAHPHTTIPLLQTSYSIAKCCARPRCNTCGAILKMASSK
ncbi:hypothetical protein NDU88_004290, partial [Pleurodeles waltl]